MLRTLLCAAAIFVLVLSVCLLPQTASARRCPVKEPETLLSLYQNSDAIYIASYDKTVDGEILEATDDYTAVEIKKHFTISSTLKGQNRKFFVLEDRDYRYKTALPETNVVEVEPESEEAGDDPSELKSGDTLLLFIRNSEEKEAPTLTDYRDGIKKLSTERMSVYEARIKDLNSIFGEKKVNEQRLMEWLIRCAEDPATRWEGTFELLRSVQNQEWQEQAAERRKERIARGEPVEEEPTEEAVEQDGEHAEAGPQKNFDTSIFAKRLDANHKQTLANILLNGQNATAGSGEKREPVAGDRELVELVKRFGDPRLVGFLIDKLRAGAEAKEYASETMEMIAGLLDDDEAGTIAEKYSDNVYENDEDFVEEESEESDEPEPTGEVIEAQPEDGDASPDPVLIDKTETDNESDETTDAKAPKKQTYKELRTELMQKFLARCDFVITERDKEKEGKIR